MKFLWYSLQTLFILALLGVVGLFAMPYLPLQNNIELRIVESGSMEPAISTGSLVIVHPAESYEAGDVITFESRFADVPTTHRIIDTYEERGETFFVTKGDANEERDVDPVPSSAVLGSVVVDVPRAGFVLDFARQPLGFLLLIVLPAFLIILSELEKIWHELRSRRRSRKDGDDDNDAAVTPTTSPPPTASPRPSMMDVGTPVRFRTLATTAAAPPMPAPVKTRRWPAELIGAGVASLLAVILISSSFIGSTVSYFNDLEISLDNFLSAIALDVTASGDDGLFQFIGTDPNGSDTLTLTLGLENDSVDVVYDVSVELIGTLTTLCQQLQAEAGAPIAYNGSLLSLAANGVTFNASPAVVWSLPDDTGVIDGEVCQVELVLGAKAAESIGSGGYLDEERIPVTFTYQAPVQPVAAPFGLPAASLAPTTQSSVEETTGDVSEPMSSSASLKAPAAPLDNEAMEEQPEATEQKKAPKDDAVEQTGEPAAEEAVVEENENDTPEQAAEEENIENVEKSEDVKGEAKEEETEDEEEVKDEQSEATEKDEVEKEVTETIAAGEDDTEASEDTDLEPVAEEADETSPPVTETDPESAGETAGADSDAT